MKTKQLSLAALFCALTAVASQLIIPIAPVPFSLSLIAVYLTGLLLEKKTALWAQMAYLLLGAVGAPVFSSFSGGLGKLVGPTGGYLFVYPLMALVVAWAVEKWGHKMLCYTISMLAALALCYAVGTLWLMWITKSNLVSALGMAVLPFIPLDMVKIGLSAVLVRSLQPVLVKLHIIQPCS